MQHIAEQKSYIKMEKITKSFGGFLALDNVNFDLRRGEIHALLGENGAGKSSLMNVLAGHYAPDSGHVILAGNAVDITGPSEARALGVGMVHQHYKLVKTFSALDNIALTVPHGAYLPGVRNLRSKVVTKMKEIGFELDLDRPVGQLSVAEQQRVEILKVLVGGASIIILDEPTAVLTDEESVGFFKTIEKLSDAGTSVVLVTHKLREAVRYSDRITVMRGGRIVDTVLPGDINDDQLIKLIVGEVITEMPKLSESMGNKKLSLRKLNLASVTGVMALKDITFNIRAGEIYGIAGVGGNGQAELALLLMGLIEPDSGTINLAGHGDITRLCTGQRRRCGLVFIPADRQRYALAGELSVAENYAVSGILRHEYGSWLKVNRRLVRRLAAAAIEDFDVQGVRNLNQNAAILSGGNAQKLVIAREFSSLPSVVIAHSPSRGLDLRASAAVHEQLRRARDAGAAVLLISEDLDEVMLLSDTIGVINRGEIVAEFSSPADRQKIGKAMVH